MRSRDSCDEPSAEVRRNQVDAARGQLDEPADPLRSLPRFEPLRLAKFLAAEAAFDLARDDDVGLELEGFDLAEIRSHDLDRRARQGLAEHPFDVGEELAEARGHSRGREVGRPGRGTRLRRRCGRAGILSPCRGGAERHGEGESGQQP